MVHSSKECVACPIASLRNILVNVTVMPVRIKSTCVITIAEKARFTRHALEAARCTDARQEPREQIQVDQVDLWRFNPALRKNICGGNW